MDIWEQQKTSLVSRLVGTIKRNKQELSTSVHGAAENFSTMMLKHEEKSSDRVPVQGHHPEHAAAACSHLSTENKRKPETVTYYNETKGVA